MTKVNKESNFSFFKYSKKQLFPTHTEIHTHTHTQMTQKMHRIQDFINKQTY